MKKIGKVKKSEMIMEMLQMAYLEEKADFLEDSTDLTDFQKGVLFGLKLAAVKTKKVLDKKSIR